MQAFSPRRIAAERLKQSGVGVGNLFAKAQPPDAICDLCGKTSAWRTC